MRKGDISPMMWMVLGLIVLLALIVVILALKGKSFDLISGIKGALP